jgi:hypothetical protein
MAMSPETQEEYDRALKTALIANGDVVESRPSTYGWKDYDATEHLRSCGGWSERPVEDDAWHEFIDSYEGSAEKHGQSVSGVTCECGVLGGRTVRWDAQRDEIAEAVFEIAFGPKKR